MIPVASPAHEERKPLPYSTFAKNWKEGQEDKDIEHYIARKQENYAASNNL